MRLILTGNSRYSRTAEELLAKSGCETEWREPGEAFAAGDDLPVLYFPGNTADAFLTDDAYVEKKLTDKIRQLKKADIPVLFLLDREREASADLIRLVLLRAKALRERKRPLPVLVAASSVRCQAGDLEELYRETRQSGVVFLKYDSVTLPESEDSDMVVLTEGGTSYEIDAPLRILCEDRPGAETEAFAKKLRLRRGEGKKYSGAKWFLPTGFTARRNVWVLEDDIFLQNPQAALAGIAQEAERLGGQPEELAAVVDDAKCAFCYTCYRVCPHAAPTPDPEHHAMKVDVTLCVGCGLCEAVCPAGAIERKDIEGLAPAEDEVGKRTEDAGRNREEDVSGEAREEQTGGGTETEAVEGKSGAKDILGGNPMKNAGGEDITGCNPVQKTGGEDITGCNPMRKTGGEDITGRHPMRKTGGEDIPGGNLIKTAAGESRMLVFCCENSAALAAEAFAGVPANRLKVSCGGEVNESRILRALKQYDRVLLAVCAKSACRHFDGNTRCELQAERAKKTLESLGMDPGRVRVVKASFAAAGEIREAAEAFAGCRESGSADG